MSKRPTVRWKPTGEGRRWVTDDPRFAGCVLAKKWITSTVGPFVIQFNDGEGQVAGFGPSIAKATECAIKYLPASQSLQVRLGPPPTSPGGGPFRVRKGQLRKVKQWKASTLKGLRSS